MEVAGRLRLRVGAVNWDDGEPGRTGVVFKGRSRDRGRGWGKGIPGGFAGDLGGPSRGEDDPTRRARLVSETGRGSRASALSRQRALMCGPGAQRAKRVRAVRRALHAERGWQVGSARQRDAATGERAVRARGGADPWGWLASEKRRARGAAGASGREQLGRAGTRKEGGAGWAAGVGLGRRRLGCGFGLGKEKERARREGGVGLGQAVSWVGLGFESSSFLFLFYF